MEAALNVFIRNVEELLEERGWTQKKLAEQASLTPGAISFYLSGKTAPQLEAMSRIATALGVSMTRLLLTESDEVLIKREKVQPTAYECLEIIKRDLDLCGEIPTEVRPILWEIAKSRRWDEAKAALNRVLSKRK